MEIDELVNKLRQSMGTGAPTSADVVRRDGENTRDSWSRIQGIVERHSGSVQQVLEAYSQQSTLLGPCDRKKAEQAVRAVYDAGRRQHPQFIWFESPLPAIRAAAAIQLRDKMQPKSKVNSVLSSDVLLAASVAGYDDLHNAISRHLDRITTPFIDYDARIGRSLWAMMDAERHTTALEEALDSMPAELVNASDLRRKLLQFTDYARGYEKMNAVRPVLNVNQQFNRLTSCRLGPGDGWDLAQIHARKLFGVEPGGTFAALCETMRECGWWWPFKEVCIMCERPKSIVFEGTRLHVLNGPAVEYMDGFAMYFFKDIAVTKKLSYCQFTAVDIDAEPNAELRRVMMDRFGFDRYLIETQMQQMQKDAFGTLYRKELSNDEPIVVVKVKNSTPEPDGSFKNYFIRVPPRMETAREAVAWTFGLEEDEYDPSVQT